MELTLKQKKNIVGFIPTLSEVVKRDKWISNYDTESDSMVIRTPSLSGNVEKKYVNDEFAFYLNKNNKVEGILIEYFMANFVSHHDGVKSFKKELQKEFREVVGNEQSSVVTLKSSETKRIIPSLENVLLNSVISKSRIGV